MINSFKYKFILSFVTVEIFFIICIVSINFFTINESSSKLIKNRIDSSTELLKDLIKSPISVYDLATIDNVVHESSFKNINSIVILDMKKRILSKKYNFQKPLKELLNLKKDTLLKIKDKEYNLKFAKISNEDIDLGYIYIIFDMSEFTKIIDENRINTFVIVLIEILLSTLIAYLIGYRLTSNLKKLSKTAEKIGKSDNLSIPIPYKDDKSEIGILANSLNKMRKNMLHRNKILKASKDIFENIKEAIIVFNENGDITLVNNEFFNITQTPKEKFLNKNIFKLEFGIPQSKILFLLEEVKDTDEYKEEYVLTKENSRNKIILINISKIQRKDHLSYILIFNDITSEKERESLLQVQSRMATMGEMIGNIAHQWRQPLSAISTTASGLKVQLDLEILKDDFLESSLNDILTTTGFLSDTIEDFRDFFKTQKETVDFRVSDIVFKISNILNTILRNRNIELRDNFKDNPIINGYQNELTQALINIINNAKDVLESKEELDKKIIFVDTIENKEDKNITIKIWDNAGGIPEDIIDKIFEPYFTTKHQSQGTGIGLYMTHTIITKHFGGKIKAENKVKEIDGKEYEGACFQITLPLEQKKAK